MKGGRHCNILMLTITKACFKLQYSACKEIATGLISTALLAVENLGPSELNAIVLL